MEIQQTIKEIDEMRDALYERKLWNDGEVLSQAIVKLAALNSYLGEQVAQAELDASGAESHYKTTREARKLELVRTTTEKVSMAQAEAQAYIETVDELELWNKSQYNYKLLSTKRQDTNNLIDAMRSRLSFMRAEREKAL